MPGSRTSQARRHPAADLLVKAPPPAVDLLAGMQECFEQLCAEGSERLSELAPVPMELMLREFATGAIADAVERYGEAGAAAAFGSPDRSAAILIGADRAFIDCAVEAVFGSDGSEPSSPVERAPTGIELRLARGVFERLADALRGTVFGAEAGPLVLESIEPAAELAAPAAADQPHLIAKLALSALEREGEICIAIPQAAVEETRRAAMAPPAAPAARDQGWSRRIEHEVQRTQVTLQAVLDERELTLGEIAELRVGQLLPLKATPRSNVKVVCNDQTLFWCELGQTEGVYTLRIKDFPDDEQELIDAITSG